MVESLFQRLNALVSGAVLLREAARTSRRWQTYATRAMFSAILMGFTVVGIYIATEISSWDPARMGQLGRGLFIAFAVVQTLLGFIFAPLMVSRAIIEERVDKTVELLVLTRLTPTAVLGGKVLSRILVLMTIIAGALPVLALVTTLGGVSVVEVVAVTLHTLVAVVVLGTLGGFFAVFTRSPFIATAATLIFAFITFVGSPLIYLPLTGLPKGAAHISPLYGTASQDWFSLLPLLAYLPSTALIVRVGAQCFQLRVSGARLRRFFDKDLWGTRWFWGVVIGSIVYACTVLPAGIAGSWFYAMAPAMRGSTWWHSGIQGISVASIWLWCVALLYITTWVYMRLAMDMVMVVDASLSPSGGKKNERRGPPHIRGNPIVWREVRPAAWRVAVPGLVGWLLVLVVVFQMGIWVVPGGLLAIGGVNAAAAMMLTVWMATSSIERERHDGTLALVLTTTLSSWRVMLGKAMGVLAPSFAMLFISFPMIVLGVPHLQLVIDEKQLGASFVRGIFVCLWLIPFQWLLLVVAFIVALRMKNARATYGVNMAIATVVVALPLLAEILFPKIPFIVWPARLIMPVLSPHATWWELTLSGGGMACLALVGFIVCTVRLRAWGLQHE